jgi:hypothetical protein
MLHEKIFPAGCSCLVLADCAAVCILIDLHRYAQSIFVAALIVYLVLQL